jgi:serine/threonine-protein kinase
MDGGDKYIGRILDNRYEILELIGTGGMALVYKARCHRLNRYVAVKILKEDLAGDEEFRRRFHTESQAVGMLSHPNIVAVYDVSRSENTEFIVMELIEGITLKQYINKKGLLNWKETLHFSTQVIKALSHAHSRGIIHRDIKPHNIMILKDGSVKVADFGIARLLTMQNTLTQEALGSVHYISPEQAKGGHVDARSDIYSGGVVMYEMLTSRLPFVGESAVSVAIQHISAIPLMPRELNPDIPVGLEDIAMHAMEPDLNMRFTTADEMLNDLEEFRKNPSIVFNYLQTDKQDRIPAEQPVNQETRVVKPVPPIPPIPMHENKALAIDPPRHRPVQKKQEMTADQHRTVSKRASSTSTMVGIFLILVFVVAVAVFMWNYLLKDIFGPGEKEQIEIPSFANRKYVDIIKDEEYGAYYNFREPLYEYSDDIPEGFVIRQSPQAGQMIAAPLPGNKRNIDLTVSKGEEPTVKMPYLIDLHFSQARNVLDALFMDIQIIEEPVTSNFEKGYIIETIPDVGTPLARGNSVTIIYSAGSDPKRVTVPDNLEGNPRAQLESAFRSLEITPKFEMYEDDSPVGTVLFVERKGQMITVPATIVVHISSGPPEPTETPEPTDTDEPTDSPDPDVTETPTDTGEITTSPDPGATESPTDTGEITPWPDPGDTEPPPGTPETGESDNEALTPP